MLAEVAQGLPRLSRSPNVNAMSNRAPAFVELRESQPEAPRPSVAAEEGEERGRRRLRLPSLRGRGALGLAGSEERAAAREQERRLASAEAARQAFFETPVGRARLAYRRGHRLFQYELDVRELEPTVVPGPVGAPPIETTDPVDILNAVTAEGWKLVTGKFIHSELRGGVIGCYLFKRSQKRRLPMNDPWQHPAPGA
jgi:hypothetical protein